jgi:hypothetical protein
MRQGSRSHGMGRKGIERIKQERRREGEKAGK